ncbi:MAG: hypothetical protein ACREE2_16025, partial [Stellaceae bacterium]
AKAVRLLSAGLSLISRITLIVACGAEIFHNSVLTWTENAMFLRAWIRGIGMFFLVYLLSMLIVTVLWSLYFLTDVVNRTEA